MPNRKILTFIFFIFSAVIFVIPLLRADDIEGGNYRVSAPQVTNFQSQEVSGGSYSVEIGEQSPEYNVAGSEIELSDEGIEATFVVPEGAIPAPPVTAEEESGEKAGEKEEEIEEKGALAKKEAEEEEEKEEKEKEEEEEEEEKEEELKEEAPEEGMPEEEFLEEEAVSPEAAQQIGPPTATGTAPGASEAKYIILGHKPVTSVTVIEGRVDVFNTTLPPEDPRIASAASLVKALKPYKLFKIKVGKYYSIAYIPQDEISVKLKDVKKFAKIPVLVIPEKRPDLKSEYDIMWLGAVLSKGQIYTEGQFTTADTTQMNILNEQTQSLRNNVIKYYKPIVEKQEILRMPEKEGPAHKIIRIAKKKYIILITGFVLILIVLSGVIFLFKKRGS